MRFHSRMAACIVCAALIFSVCASAYAMEMTLAGIKLGRPSSDVLKKYGNPTRITVGTVAVGAIGGNQPGFGQSPMGPMSPMMPLGPLGAAMGTYNNNLNSAMGEALPGAPGLPAPTFPGLPSAMSTSPSLPGQPGQGSNSGQVMEQETTWTYDLSDGTTVEFIISETGQVVQITVGGNKAFPGSKTTKGIKIGSQYKDVLLKYGYPEGQQYVNRAFLRVSYADRHRVIFTVLDRKVVGVTIALKDITDKENGE